ncbi:prenyltransferase [Christensenellaceae bacterium OttesenSCG-928-M15]|nr:prenyltransferase [Christensenellaceae bacterium OttesenSCG-928-M15]
MPIEEKYRKDADAILSHRYDQGGDFFTTPDHRLLKGSPFSAYNSALMLLELGMEPNDPVLQAIAALFFGAFKEDGRFALYPKGGIYPCHTTPAAYLLCRMGYTEDERIEKTFSHLLKTTYTDGGWRCNKFFFGRGPETEYSNGFPTLCALNAFRLSRHLNNEPALDKAVEFLLSHWTIKKPIGPCHYGIGTLFMQVEYPLGSYNLFTYVYVLSFYDKAKNDPRFLEAFHALKSKLVDGQIVVERVVPKLAKLNFCKKGEKSELATRRYHEILKNLGMDT